MARQKRGTATPPKGGEVKIPRNIFTTRGMIAKKKTDYLDTCYLCGTACSIANKSKALWITETVVASVCLGCFDRTNGWTKQEENLDQKFLDFVEKDLLLFGSGLVGVFDKEKKSMIVSNY